jgi:hypothetical protein
MYRSIGSILGFDTAEDGYDDLVVLGDINVDVYHL